MLSDGAVASKQVGYHPNSYKKLFAAAPDTVSRLRNIAKSFSILTWSSNINAKDVIKANGLPVSKEGTAETDAIGTYEIKYTTIDTQQNVSTVVRQVRVIPEMILYGVETMIHEQGSIFTDPGATINGDAVTSSVGVVDVDVPGTYTITYIANDESGYRYEKRRQVEVVDRDPIIALFGDTTMFIDRGTPFSDPGAIAMDGVDPEQFRDLTVEAFTLYATMTRAGGVLCDFMSNHHALFLQCRESDNPDDFWFTTSYADLAQPPQTKHANLGHVPDHIQDRLIAAFGIEKQMDLTVGKFPDVLTALPRFLEGQNITRLVLTPEGLSVPPFWASKEDMFLQSAVCIGEKCYIDGVIIPHEIDLDVTYDHSEPNFMDALDRIVDVTSAEYAIPTDAPTVAYLYDDGNGGALRWKPPDDDGNGNAPLPPFTWSAFNEIELDPIHENEEYSDDSSFKNKAWNALQSMLQGVDHVLFIVDDSHAPCVTAEAVLKHIVCGNKAFSDGSGVAIAIVKVSPAADWIDWVALDLSGAQTRDDTERVFPNDVRVHSTVSLDGRTIPIAMRVLSDGAVASKQVGYHPNSYRKKLFEAAPGTVSRPRNIAKAFSIVKVAPDASQALHAYDIIQATVALNVQSTNNVDTDTAATYEVTYTATDAQGNQATATRTVEVIDPSLAYLATRLNWLNGSDPIQDSTWVAPATLIYEIAQGDTQALNEYARYQPPYEMEITSDDQVQLRSHNMHAYLVIDGTIIPSTNLFNENAHRILIKDAVEQRANGIYWVQDVDVTTSNMGTVHSVWTLQRSAADFYMHGGVISVQEGIYNKNRRFKLVDLNPNINNITGDNLAFENVDN